MTIISPNIVDSGRIKLLRSKNGRAITAHPKTKKAPDIDLGHRLEAFRAAVDFELSRAELNVGLGYSDRSEGRRPPFDR